LQLPQPVFDMKNKNQTKCHLLRLVDNRFGAPNNADQVRVISTQEKNILSRYDGIELERWRELGVAVFSNLPLGDHKVNDESTKSALFTLESDAQVAGRTWVNTNNCMGVVKLRDKETGEAVQIEIGSRFDGNAEQFFLTYLLSKVFGGSIVDLVDLGRDSLWDMLLAFLFRRRLQEASAIGLFKQYQTFNHNDTRVRGRIDVNEHLRRNIPFSGKVASVTHEITFDNPTNHLIRHALVKVGRKWGGLLAGGDIMDVRNQLEQATPRWQPGEVAQCIRRKENRTQIKHPYFRSVYEPLRHVSLAILRDEGAGLYHQHQEAEGVIFDGSWLWEEYLWTLLQPLGFEHPENKKKDGAWKPLNGVKFYPDFFHRGSRAILDAKYKRGENRYDGRQDHARQVFGYMFLLNAIHGGLVKPDGVLDDPEQISRKVINTEPAFWHDFVLTPSKKSTAIDFVAEMRRKEDEFQKNVTRSLKL